MMQPTEPDWQQQQKNSCKFFYMAERWMGLNWIAVIKWSLLTSLQS